MPRLAIKHENTIMYKIVCNDLNIKDLYVGSTTNFCMRKSSHKGRCCNEKDKKYHYKVYQFIRANGGWGNWSMLEIEKFTCNDSNEAHTRERFWIETLQSTLNCYSPIRTPDEDKVSQKTNNTNYYIANSERLNEKMKCVCGSSYAFQGKLRHLKRQTHLAFLENPDFLRIKQIASKERLNEKITCLCGSQFIFKYKSDHSKTQKHLAYLNTLEPLALAI